MQLAWVAFVVVVAAQSERPADRSDELYREAVRLYRAVELEKSAATFAKVRDTLRDDRERAHVHAWLGLIHAQLGDDDTARAEFRTAVTLDRRVEMPATAPAAVSALLESERDALPPAAAPPPPPPPPEELADVPRDQPEAPAAARIDDDDEPSVDEAPAPEPRGLSTPRFVALLVGGGALVAAGAVAGVGVDTAFRQARAAQFNDDANRLLDTAYFEYGIAGGLAVFGVVTIAIGLVAE